MRQKTGPFAAMLTLHQVRLPEFRKSFRCAARRGARISFCVLLLVLWHFHEPLLIPRAIGEHSMPNRSVSPEASLEDAFAAAVRKLDEDRKTNHANNFECTQFFSEFYRFRQIEPYIAFFQKIGIPAIIEDANRKHYFAFELTREQLSYRGYNDFLRDDRLVIVSRPLRQAQAKLHPLRAAS